MECDSFESLKDRFFFLKFRERGLLNFDGCRFISVIDVIVLFLMVRFELVFRVLVIFLERRGKVGMGRVRR